MSSLQLLLFLLLAASVRHTAAVTDAECAVSTPANAPEAERACALRATAACGCGFVQEILVSPGDKCCAPAAIDSRCVAKEQPAHQACTVGLCSWAQWQRWVRSGGGRID